MKNFKSPSKFQREMEKLRSKALRIGFVPTMGALHEGHLSLVRAARRENDIVAVSIFVNPAQFGPREDFGRYPRVFARDFKLLQREHADYVFSPSVSSMYPRGYQTSVAVGGANADRSLSHVLCGKFRPGHFQGVVTVVAKLFHLAQPHRVYFGAKDYQQALIVGRLIRDLNFPIKLCVRPIVREKDGLAMSSRNFYLNSEERKRACQLPKILFALRDRIQQGQGSLREIKRQALKELRRAADKVDYLEVVDPASLETVVRPQPNMLAAAACFIGKTRLIDNVIIRKF